MLSACWWYTTALGGSASGSWSEIRQSSTFYVMAKLHATFISYKLT